MTGSGAVVAPAHNRPAPRWHGYGFLPGYLNHRITAFQRPESVGFAHGVPQRAFLVYRSNPKLLRVRWRLALFRLAWFYGGRYNGGSFGPCWTRTPIGPIWIAAEFIGIA
jgi:hypothetical protein